MTAKLLLLHIPLFGVQNFVTAKLAIVQAPVL